MGVDIDDCVGVYDECGDCNGDGIDQGTCDCSGNVELGQCSHLGICSAVNHHITIQDNTIIGAQSLVLKNCDKNSIYFGIPAKKIKDRENNSNYL